MSGIDSTSHEAQSMAARFFLASLGTAEVIASYIGIRLGLYEALRRDGPATAADLAERASIAPRYAREWLEQQAAAAIVEVDDAAKTGDERLYILPPGHAEALLSPDSPSYISPLALMPIAAMTRILPSLLDAYRTGQGIPTADYGQEFRDAQRAVNRALFRHDLARWIRSALPDVHETLTRGGVRVADLACGGGWSSIAMAAAYPDVHVDGYDMDSAAVTEARANAAAAGVASRVTFEQRDVSALGSDRRYALVCLFDALHDMPRPVDVLRYAREICAIGGAVLLMEPNAGDAFAAPAGETERFLYAISLLHCLPVGLAEAPSTGTGTMIRPSIVRAYASEARFAGVNNLGIEHRFYRFYRLLP